MPVKRDKALIKVGPFTGGVNLLQKRYPSEMDDTECRELVNLDPTDDAVVARRGFRSIPNTGGTIYTAPLVKFHMLGQYFNNVNNTIRPIVGKVTAANSTTIYVGNSGVSSIWTSVDFTTYDILLNEFCNAVFYNGFYWFVALTTGNTNSYRLDNVLAVPTLFTTIPKGDKAFIWKDRLWVLNKSTNTISWSKATDPGVFAAPDGGFVTISGIDGQLITDMIVINDTMYIFKDNSYYQFNFTGNPAVDGYLREVSRGTGAYIVIQHEDRTFLLNRDGVQEFINGNMTNLSEKINFRSGASTTNLRLNILNNMLIISSAVGTVDIEGYYSQFAMNLDTGAWTTYISYIGTTTGLVGPYSKGIYCSFVSYNNVLWGHDKTVLSYAVDKLPNPEYEFPEYDRYFTAPSDYVSPEYRLVTKTYDLEDAMAWKKITSIAAEARSNFAAADADVTYKLWLDIDDPLNVLANPAGTPKTSLFIQLKEENTAVLEGIRRNLAIGRYRCRQFTLGFEKPSAVIGATTNNFPTWFYQFYVTVVRKAYETIVKNV